MRPRAKLQCTLLTEVLVPSGRVCLVQRNIKIKLAPEVVELVAGCAYSSVLTPCWQAAVLWRCADCFENGMIKQSDFHKLLASLLGPTVDDVKLLKESDGLTQMMTCSQCLEEDGKANIRKFVQHCFRLKDGDLPLEDESWDHLLFQKLMQALGLENEVVSHACTFACLQNSFSTHDDLAMSGTLVLTLVDGMGEGRTCRAER